MFARNPFLLRVSRRCMRYISTDVPASSVKELRTLTGLPIMDCKKALISEGGDITRAIAWLKKKGLTVSLDRLSKSANEGLIISQIRSDCSFMLEINSETDFVAKNQDFKLFCVQAMELCNKLPIVHGPIEIPQLMSLLVSSSSNAPLSEVRSELSYKMKENVQIRRGHIMVNKPYHVISSYMHSNQSLTSEYKLGKIASMIDLADPNNPNTYDSPHLASLSYRLCMHLAASQSKPIHIWPDQINPAVIEEMRATVETGDKKKPFDDVFEEHCKKTCLVSQIHLLEEGNQTILKLLADNGQLVVKDFVVFQIGA